MRHIHPWRWWDLPHRHHNGKHCQLLDGVRMDWSGNRWRTVSDQEKKEGVVTKFKEKVHRPQMEGMVVGLFTSRHESGRFESVCLTTIPWPTLTHWSSVIKAMFASVDRSVPPHNDSPDCKSIVHVWSYLPLWTSFFFIMRINKTKPCSRLTHEHLNNIMTLAAAQDFDT